MPANMVSITTTSTETTLTDNTDDASVLITYIPVVLPPQFNLAITKSVNLSTSMIG